MHRPVEGELQGAAVERPGFGVSGVRGSVVELRGGYVTDSAACLEAMVGGLVWGVVLPVLALCLRN